MTSADGARSGEALETVEINTGANPEAAIIWLHGLGADGHDFEPIVPQLLWPGAPAMRFVFPHAPIRPVTINNGMQMRAWYDIVEMSLNRGQDKQGITQSIGLATELVRRERERGVVSEKIILAGFSQGGAIAIQSALAYPETLGGLIALSTYLLHDEDLEDRRHESNRDLPVFVGHGTSDPMVPCFLGERVAGRLREIGHAVEWHSYPMMHAVCPQEIQDLAVWLRKCLA